MHVRDDVAVYTFLTLSGSSRGDDVLLHYIFIPLLLQHFVTTIVFVLLRRVCALQQPRKTKTHLYLSVFFPYKLLLIDRLAIFLCLP